MKVLAWEQRRPVSPWLPAAYTREYVSEAEQFSIGRPVLNSDLCNLCGICWACCPEGAISRAGAITVDMEDCRGCGICAMECPRRAIDMKQE